MDCRDTQNEQGPRDPQNFLTCMTNNVHLGQSCPDYHSRSTHSHPWTLSFSIHLSHPCLNVFYVVSSPVLYLPPPHPLYLQLLGLIPSSEHVIVCSNPSFHFPHDETKIQESHKLSDKDARSDM